MPDGLSYETYEAPPGYSPGNELSPAYSAQGFHEQFITYRIRAMQRDNLHLVAYEPAANSTQPSYEVRFRSSTALAFFSRKAGVSLQRVPPPSSGERTVAAASARFYDKGGFPYCPRARLRMVTSSQDGRGNTVEMQSKDWQD